MDERGKEILSIYNSLWKSAFQIPSRQVVVSSLVGLCGIGLYWTTQRWLAMTQYELQLIKEHGKILQNRL